MKQSDLLGKTMNFKAEKGDILKVLFIFKKQN